MSDGAIDRWRWLLRTGGQAMRREFWTLALLAAVTFGVWGFLELADEIGEGTVQQIDRAVVMAMRTPGDPTDPLGPGWFEEMMRDLTAFGGIAVLTGFTLAVAGFLLIDRKRHAALLVVVAVGGGLLLSNLLKDLYDRPRPDLVPHGSIVYTSSFPSGHSMLSAVTFLTLGALLARVQGRRALKAYLLALAVAITLAVGVSRVYLGVHWPTDVLAGWSAGAAWALLCWLVALRLQRRGQVEEEGERS